jgi:protein TonB
LTNKEYYRLVDTMPEYPGGKLEMVKFFMSNFNYLEPEATGRIIIEFTVNKEGKLEDFKILRSLIDLLDNEAIRVMKLMPNWKPGKCGDEKVDVKLIVPWIIRLE